MAHRDWTPLDARALRRWPLPEIPDDADKEFRGSVLVVAGSREIPGAALLAATAALRAGAGKLVIATGQSVAAPLALAVPEARVIALRETDQGSFSHEGLALLRDSAQSTDAALIGPGLMDAAGTCRFVEGLLPLLSHAPVVLDALAMEIVCRGRALAQPVLLTPHAGEMAHLSGLSKKAVLADPQHTVTDAASRWQAVVALKGAATLIAHPRGAHWLHDGGHPGLATSGSGDVLAGLIAGLAAQQVPLEQACVWGVVLHALAGAKLARRFGPTGFLARELPAEVPALMRSLRRPARRKAGPPRPRE